MHLGHTTQQAAYSRALNTSMSDHNESHLDPAMLLDEATNSTSPSYSQTTDGVAVFLPMESSAAWFSMICAGAWKGLVMNLFGNSLKFCSAGHIEVTLRMIPDPKNSEKRLAHLVVNDTGIGISEQFSKHGIFRLFVQENFLVNGTGLGLHIVKRIVDDMQGTISVQSVLGSGTRFDVTIPMVE
jgi:signal transduction histidine kinase